MGAQSCPTLCGPMDQAPLSMGFSRQEYWSGLPCPPPQDLPNPGMEPRLEETPETPPSSRAEGLLFLHARASLSISNARVSAKSLQSCPTLCDPIGCSPLGSPVHRISQARILESVAMPSSTGSSQPRDRTHVSYISCTGRRVLYKLPHNCTHLTR